MLPAFSFYSVFYVKIGNQFLFKGSGSQIVDRDSKQVNIVGSCNFNIVFFVHHKLDKINFFKSPEKSPENLFSHHLKGRKN